MWDERAKERKDPDGKTNPTLDPRLFASSHKEFVKVPVRCSAWISKKSGTLSPGVATRFALRPGVPRPDTNFRRDCLKEGDWVIQVEVVKLVASTASLHWRILHNLSACGADEIGGVRLWGQCLEW
jgi:hypothetical protein